MNLCESFNYCTYRYFLLCRTFIYRTVSRDAKFYKIVINFAKLILNFLFLNLVSLLNYEVVRTDEKYLINFSGHISALNRKTSNKWNILSYSRDLNHNRLTFEVKKHVLCESTRIELIIFHSINHSRTNFNEREVGNKP